MADLNYARISKGDICQSLTDCVLYLKLIGADSKQHGMQAAVWGPVGWKFLHSVAHGFPVDPIAVDVENGKQVGTTANNYKRFFTLVGHVLPCRYCRDSYQTYVAEAPPMTSSRSNLTRWLWDTHNKVNEKLGVSYSGAEYDSVYNTYETYRAKCTGAAGLGCTTPES